MTRVLLVMTITFTLVLPLAFAQHTPKEETMLAPTDLNRVNAGQPAPDFTLENYDGKPITLSGFRGKKNVVLVFYRGHW